eukprot:5754349-Pyramimonas_sp.AAC.1
MHSPPAPSATPPRGSRERLVAGPEHVQNALVIRPVLHERIVRDGDCSDRRDLPQISDEEE